MRITADLKRRLLAAAEEHAHSISAEVEARLEASFERAAAGDVAREAVLGFVGDVPKLRDTIQELVKGFTNLRRQMDNLQLEMKPPRRAREDRRDRK